MKITKYQIDAITCLRAKLDVTHPACMAGGNGLKGLKQARLYIEAHVLPLLDFIEGKGFSGQHHYVAREAASVRLALRAAEKRDLPNRKNAVKIVSAPVAGSAYPKGFKWDTYRCLYHAVEIDPEGQPIRALCGQVKPESILPDSTQYDLEPVNCERCLAKIRPAAKARLGGRQKVK